MKYYHNYLNKIGKISKLLLSPSDKNTMIFLGTHGINWITKDCGVNVKALNHGRKIQDFTFHPTEKEWGLASAFSICEDYVVEPCSINKEVFVTRDLGVTWQLLASYVVQFGWYVTELI